MKFVLYAAALVAAVIDPHAATAATLSEIYGFAGGTDGLYPASIQVNAKAIFGTTLRGGTAGLGTVFRIDRATGMKTTLHSFGGGADGSNPSGAVVLSGGFLYGTTSAGGTGGDDRGTLYRVSLSTGAETVLYSFGFAGGEMPQGGVTRVGSVLYGTTSMGGAGTGRGTVFRYDLTTGIESMFHAFAGIADANDSISSLLAYKGALYGTSIGGGSLNYGTVFRVALGTGAETVLHSFTGPDGRNLQAPLTEYAGLLYGTTVQGGGSDLGVLFSMDPVSGTAATLITFGSNTAGASPTGRLVYANGGLYGTTALGGGGSGLAFRLNLADSTETPVLSFPPGTEAFGLVYSSGSFLGIDFVGGSASSGSIFQLVP